MIINAMRKTLLCIAAIMITFPIMAKNKEQIRMEHTLLKITLRIARLRCSWRGDAGSSPA